VLAGGVHLRHPGNRGAPTCERECLQVDQDDPRDEEEGHQWPRQGCRQGG